MLRRRHWPLAAAALVLGSSTALAQPKALPALDPYVEKAMRDWKVPGVAIAIVRNDSILLAKGYGVRTLGHPERVDEHTLFAIGSSSKAFTATLVAFMVDERKMQWDAPATTYLPGLELYDPYATRELTVRDLLSHRSGLARGDLLWYGSGVPSEEIVRRVRFLKPSWSFRSRFGYQNLMYLTAGEAVSHVAGRPWADLVRERIFEPLGMTESNTSITALAGKPNVASPHAEIEDTLRVIAWRNIDNIAPAGAINSTVTDMAQWVRFHLNGGKVGGKQLLSQGTLAEEYAPNTVIPISTQQRAINPETHLMSYGMGWFLQDYRGRLVVQHGGNIDGMSALVAMLPEQKTGLVILTNKNGTALTTVLMNRIFDILLGVAPRDWSAELLKATAAQMEQAKAAAKKIEEQRVVGTKPSLALDRYAGTYADSMYGETEVTFENGALRARLGRAFDGALEHWHYDTFRAAWRDPMLGKTFLTFVLGTDGKVAKMEVDGIGEFGRRPERADTTAAVTLAASALQKFTGSYANDATKLTVDVQLVSGTLRLTVPGQPTYTLVADSPTRFRLTGPPGMPAGFFIDFAVTGERVTGATLIQPSPRPSLTLEKK